MSVQYRLIQLQLSELEECEMKYFTKEYKALPSPGIETVSCNLECNALTTKPCAFIQITSHNFRLKKIHCTVL